MEINSNKITNTVINNNHAQNTGNIVFAMNYFDKEVTYRVQEFRGFGIQLLHPSGGTRFGQMVVQGDTPIYETLHISFIMDEKFKIFKDFVNLMQTYWNTVEGKGEYLNEYGQANLRIMNNDFTENVLDIDIKNIVLDGLGELGTTTLNDGSSVFTYSVIFRYDSFKINPTT